MEAQLLKLWKKQTTDLVTKLGDKYNFNVEEALKYLNPEVEEKNRGRPEKKTKKVVNKTAMVEDVIQTIMDKTSEEAVEVAAPVVEKKKVNRKKSPAPVATPVVAEVVAPVVTEVVAPVAAEVVAPVVAEVVTPVVEKKKVTKKKAASPAPEETATTVPVEVVAPVVVEKKKVTKKKAASPAPEETVTPVPVEVAAPVVVEKKKVTKKKAEVVAPVVTEVVAPVVVEKKKVVVKEKTPEPAEELVEEEITEEEDNADDYEEWTHLGTTYYKSCDKKCGESNCNCTGTLCNVETHDPVGTWDGKAIVPLANED